MSKYKPYPKYKDSGVEWLGQVPEEWPVIRVGYGYDVLLGKMLQPLSKGAEDRLVPYLKALNVQWENITGELSEMWASDSEIQKFSIRKGDLLVCEGGEVGRCALVPYHPDSICIIQNSLHRVRATKGYSVNYLLRVLETANGASWFDILCNKATIAHFTRDKFVSLRFPAPDIDTQGKIAEYLNQECSHIDTIISKQEHLIELLEEKRISIISHAVTEGLNPDAPTKDSGVEWLGKVPKRWLVGRIKNIATINPSRSELRGLPDDSEVGFLPMESIGEKGLLDTSRVVSLNSVASGYTYVADGDILLAKITPCFENGKGAIACNLPNKVGFATTEVIPIRVMQENDARYLFYLLSSSAFRKRAEGAMYGAGGQKRVPDSFVTTYPIAIPPFVEQQAIATFLDRETAKIDATINKTRQAIALAKERRAAIISAAVTGKICVTSQQKAGKPLSKSREYFQKVVLAAEITDQLHKERTFGRVKLQKILYLSEYHAQLPFQRSEYQRYAAGPHDPKAMYSIEGQMKKQKWFDSRRREGGYGKEYVPLERHEAYKQYYERYFVEKHEVIQRIIDLLRPKDTQFCEVVATLYGVWNDFLLEGQQPDDAAMFLEAVTNWAPEKKEVPPGLWPKALHWMRENGLVPTGWGEPTIHRQEA